MSIRQASESDLPKLVDLWLRSVRATHDFLTEDDIAFLLPLVQSQALPNLELWVADQQEQIAGFVGLAGNKVEALFIAPEFFRQGLGRQLIDHARALQGPLLVDVNEQNPAARAFYESLGFRVIGRSPLDSTGRPFPLLHLSEENS